MNKNYYYILGEINEYKFVINFVFYESMIFKIDDTEYNVNKYSCLQKIFDVKTRSIKLFINGIFNHEININLEKPIYWKINFLNCDCQFIPECGLKDQVQTGYDCINFHLGDQIYLDLVYLKLAKDEYDEEKIRKAIYEEYRIGFFERKLKILQNSFNIMLGDDHDISDESIRIEQDKRYNNCFKKVFEEIQLGLRLSDSKFVIYNDMRFILIDNINTLSHEEYIFECNKILRMLDSTVISNFILSPRNMMNTTNNCLYNIIFSSENNITNYNSFYDILFEMKKKHEMKFTILCGDEHSSGHYTINDKKRGKIDLYFVGPLNSVIDFIKNDFFIKSDILSSEEILYCKKHSFIEITRANNLEFVYDFKCSDYISPFIYSLKFLKQKLF